MGKGSRNRTKNFRAFRQAWNRIFGKPNKKTQPVKIRKTNQ